MERNCSCVWLFWRMELCSAYQRGEGGTDCVQGVMDLQFSARFLTLDMYVLNEGQVGTNYSLYSPDCPL